MENIRKLPVVFVRELVIFPGMSTTLTVGRPQSRLAVEAAQTHHKNLVVTLTQRCAEDTEILDLGAAYSVGAVCRIERSVALTDGGMQVQVTGIERIRATTLVRLAGVAMIEGATLIDSKAAGAAEVQEVLQHVSTYQPGTFENVAWLERSDPEALKKINHAVAKRQEILEEDSEVERLKLLREGLLR